MIKQIKNIIESQLYPISLYARQIAGTCILFIIARYIAVYDYGLFSSYKNIAIFCLFLVNMGYGDYILVSSQANVTKVRQKISLFLLNAFVSILLILIISQLFPFESHFLFFLVLLRTFFDNIFFALILPYFQASGKFKQIAYINFFYSFGIVVIGIVSYVLKLSLIKFLIISILLGIFNFIQCNLYIKTNYLYTLKNIFKLIKLIDKEILSFIGATLACYLYSQMTSLYVSIVLKKELAALYFSAFTIATIIYLLVNAQAQKMIPDMINKTTTHVQKVISKNLKFILTITFAVLIFMIVCGKFLLLLFYGQNYYVNAYPILIILTLSNIFVAEAGVFGTYITASGNQKKKIPMQLEASIITFIALLCLRKYETIGVASSYLLASIYISYRYTTCTINLLKKNKQKEALCNK